MVKNQALVAANRGELRTLAVLDSDHDLSENIVDECGATCVHYAARSDNVTVLDFLVRRCGFVGTKKTVIGATPAHDAAATGNLEALEWLLKNTECSGDDVDTCGQTCVHLAARYGHLKVLQYLVKTAKCSLLNKTSSGALPLHFAAASGCSECTKSLVEAEPRSINMQMNNGATALYIASQEGHPHIIQYLAREAKASTKIRTFDGMTCLHAAAQNAQFRCVTCLVTDEGADPNERDFEGATPAHFAGSGGNEKVLNWLLQHGGRISLDNSGNSPLHDTAKHGNSKCAEILIHHGCDTELENNAGHTALELADKFEQLDTANTIRKLTHTQENPTGQLRRNSVENSGAIMGRAHSKENQVKQQVIQVAVQVHHNNNDSMSKDVRRCPNCDGETGEPCMCYMKRQRLPSEDYDLPPPPPALLEFDIPPPPSYPAPSPPAPSPVRDSFSQRFMPPNFSPILPNQGEISSTTSSLSSYSPHNSVSDSQQRFQLNNDNKTYHDKRLRRISIEDLLPPPPLELPQNKDVNQPVHHATRPPSFVPPPPPVSIPPPPPPVVRSGSARQSKPSNVNIVGNTSNSSPRRPSPTNDSQGDLLAELKATNGLMSLRRTKKSGRIIKDFGEDCNETGESASSQNNSRNIPEITTTDNTKTHSNLQAMHQSISGSVVGTGNPGPLNRSSSVEPTVNKPVSENQGTADSTGVQQGSKSADNALLKALSDHIPKTDSKGITLPLWKQQLMAKQMLDNIKKEAEQKRKAEEEAAKYQSVPAWKRALVEKKTKLDSETNVQLPKDSQSTKVTVKVRAEDSTEPEEEIDEEKLAPWQREIRLRRQ